jgi:hypothetical protein
MNDTAFFKAALPTVVPLATTAECREMGTKEGRGKKISGSGRLGLIYASFNGVTRMRPRKAPCCCCFRGAMLHGF